jgi:DNA-binding transcriptional LysR family regulator
MELRHLEVFVAVAEERSFSRAADRLHVVQSAVSATIRNLEADLGVELLHRTSRRVELTDAGTEVLPEARVTLAAAQATRDAADGVRGGLRGTVRLGIMQVQRGTEFRVARLLAAFGAEHPGVRVVARQRGSVVQADDVREGRLDLALVGLPEERLSGLRVDALTREDVALVVPRGHRLAGRASVALADLDGERFVDVPPEWGTRTGTDAAFTAAGLTRDVAFDLNDTGSVVDFVRHGLAIALIPASFVGPSDGDPVADDVVLVPLRGRPLKFVTSLVTPANRPMTAASRALRETALRVAGVTG